jgi:hypothetical protein
MTDEEHADRYIRDNPLAAAYRDDLIDLFSYFHSDYYKQISCGYGWLKIILAGHKALKLVDPDYKIAQIKEKFGGLRYYIDNSPFINEDLLFAVRAITERAETIAASTCEECGINTNVHTSKFSGWIHTLCYRCDLQFAKTILSTQKEHSVGDKRVKQYIVELEQKLNIQ